LKKHSNTFVDVEDADDFDAGDDAVAIDVWPAVEALLDRSRALLDKMPDTDREEANSADCVVGWGVRRVLRLGRPTGARL